MLDAGRHPNIKVWTYSEVKEVTGEKGNFKVIVSRKSRGVDENSCVGCGDCAKECPVIVPNAFDLGLGARKAIYSPFPQASPRAYVIDREYCLNKKFIVCERCSEVCKPKSIDYDMLDKDIEISVGSIILATGFEEYDPTILSCFDYSLHEDVVTGLEFERLLNASGPTGGHIRRPSDRKLPKTLAFIQCVGSRSNDNKGVPYCSYFCCMNAVKNSIMAKVHEPEIEKIYIFYHDLRAFGKGYEDLYLKAKADPSVVFYHGKPSKIIEDPKTKELWIAVENMDTGKIERIKVDLTILSSTAVPSSGTKELAEILGIELDHSGFFKTKDITSPLESTKEGIYLCGCAGGLKDITDSVAFGSGSALKVSSHLKGQRVKKEPVKVEPIDISGPPRVGVFVCHCGINIAGVVDVNSVEEYAKSLPDVVFVMKDLFVCSDGTQRLLQDKIKEHKLNRVVVAACTPRTHEPIFQETCQRAGLNPYLFEMANIRDQCSWVHANEPEEATSKAKDLIRMAVSKARMLQPLESREVQMNSKILVIGGGISGIQSALDLSSQGYKVTLIEKEKSLGGRTACLGKLGFSDVSGKELVKRKVEELNKNKVKILTSSEIKKVEGFIGNFEVTIETKGEKKTSKLKVGTIILAVGSDLIDPQGKFGYGRFPQVITNLDAEKLLQEKEYKTGGKKPEQVVFIQCVGSREKEGRKYCSRYCCQVAIKQAIALAEQGIKVTVLYRDLRTFNPGAEEAYRKARGLGVLFLRYDEENLPEVLGDSKLRMVKIPQPLLKTEVEIPADLVILSVGMVPKEKDFAFLQELLKTPRGLDGFFMERHSKLGPVETNTEGIFICGCAQSPKLIPEAIGQAIGAAGKAAILASKDKITLASIVCQVVEPELCRGCGTCVKICEFHAPSLEEKDGLYIARINEALCKGCGTCAALCPTGAIVARHFTDEQIEEMVESCLLFE
jgi:heterodisulfide reductase subunit A